MGIVVGEKILELKRLVVRFVTSLNYNKKAAMFLGLAGGVFWWAILGSNQ